MHEYHPPHQFAMSSYGVVLCWWFDLIFDERTLVEPHVMETVIREVGSICRATEFVGLLGNATGHQVELMRKDGHWSA
jgi:hypothetical protein